MAMPDAAAIEARFQDIEGYGPLFAEAFPGQEQPVTFDNMAAAIGAFERELLTPGPLEAFMAGDGTALTAEQQAGLDAFVDAGCAACHSGPLLGGQATFKLGLVEPYEDSDPGRFGVTGEEADKQVFKVPSLRNVAETGPWFHHGQVASLEEAVRLMGKHQLGKELSPQETGSIVAFLGALTGPVDAEYTRAPELPK
jgi:cytochrome c peroxidase